MERAKTSGMPDIVSGSFYHSGSIRSDHLPCAFMGPDDADKIHGSEVCPQYNRLLHVSTDYKRLCEWLIIDCEGAGDLAESVHVFS